MGTVTYRNQPAIHKTRGAVPLAGTAHIYRVERVLWPEEVEMFVEGLFLGKTLHACCGKSRIGDVLLDADPYCEPDILCDAADMRDKVMDDGFDTVLCDPPYNGKFRWNHDLLGELARVARRRIIFQHWFIPARKDGAYKKAHNKFYLSSLYCWQPRTYFGRVQMVSVFDSKDPGRRTDERLTLREGRRRGDVASPPTGMPRSYAPIVPKPSRPSLSLPARLGQPRSSASLP